MPQAYVDSDWSMTLRKLGLPGRKEGDNVYIPVVTLVGQVNIEENPVYRRGRELGVQADDVVGPRMRSSWPCAEIQTVRT
jgi:hypothetical protein